MKSVELWDVKFDKRSHSVLCLAIYIKAWPQLELILCHSVQGWIFLAWGRENKEQSSLQKKCFHVQVWVTANGLPKCEGDSLRFEHAAVLRHMKGLKNRSEILGGTTLEVLMCLKSASFGFGFLWKSFRKVTFPPLPTFAMATGYLNKYPTKAWCRNCQTKRDAVSADTAEKKKILGITRWDNSACNDATLNCVKSEPKSALPYSYGLAHHECFIVLNSALDTCFMLCC